MLISEIRPYERNARRNEKAIPAVAESIREFGFKGSIVLRSHDDPTIVCGHTRVAACKSLGWEEIPDEHIQWCDDLSDDEVKALRIADNKTGDIATYNISMLKSEVKSLGDFDMSRFGIDFKSKALPYGAERLKTDRAYNLDIVSRSDCGGRTGMPALRRCMARPRGMLGFNYAKTAGTEEKRQQACHFFIDDYQFERLWRSPEKYLPLVKRFAGALSPDFSCYMDMPLPMQRWNEYRRRALMSWWQRNGIEVVPTLSWSDPRSFGFSFAGIPKRSTVAVSTSLTVAVSFTSPPRSVSNWWFMTPFRLSKPMSMARPEYSISPQNIIRELLSPPPARFTENLPKIILRRMTTSSSEHQPIQDGHTHAANLSTNSCLWLIISTLSCRELLSASSIS